MNSMKQTFIRALLLALALSTLLCCVACRNGSYRADVTSTKITEAAKNAVGYSGDYFDASEETYDVYFGTEEAYALVVDCNIVYHVTETNVDQFGVFRTASAADAAAVEAMVKAYVDGQVAYLNSFAAAYNRDELSKIENAEVGVLGCYVYFTILSDSAADAFRGAMLASIEK